MSDKPHLEVIPDDSASFDDAVRALGDLGRDASGGELTRARVMRSLHHKRERRHSRFAIGIPLAAIFIGGAAWAGAAGPIYRAVTEWVFDSETVETPEVAEAPKPRERRSSSSLAETPATETPTEPEPATEERVVVEEPGKNDVETLREAVAVEASPRVPKSEMPARPSPEELAEAEALALYEAAHRAHFKEHDSVGAVAGYDRYLQKYPNGRFATEARYNRALCWIRLGKSEQARHALEPFANGNYGGYRAADARRLLEAMDKSKSAPAP
jgi:cytoskeletal protein RodZ